MARGALPARRPASGHHLKLFLAGDVMLGRGIDQVLPHACPPRIHEPYLTSALDYVELAERANGPILHPVDWAWVWGEALGPLAEARPAARIINLETSVTTAARAVPKGINYRMHPDNVPVLSEAGIDCCVLANNHVLDWGRAGLRETLDTLTGAHVAVAGAGRDLRAARAPAVLQAGPGHRVLVLACCTSDSGVPPSWAAGEGRSGVHLLPDLSDGTVERIGDAVRREKGPGDVAVLSIHWGGNWGFRIPAGQRRFAHAVVERGSVDVVHGHSSHHPKAVEVHGGRLILYGCGDFLDDYEGITGYEAFRADLVLMYLPTLDGSTGELVRLEMVPFVIRNFRLNRPAAGDRAWLAETLGRECRPFGHGVVLRNDVLLLK